MNQHQGEEPDLDRHLPYLQRAVELARQAREHGNHPFGALLVDDQGNILLEAENSVVTERDCTGHAETNLVRAASRKYPVEFLERCTLYTSTEPCAMCAGAIYWAGIGKVVYALSEADLRQMTGAHAENPTLDLPCREVFQRGQRRIEVIGPVDLAEAHQVHLGFWDS
ncbi:MAG: cytidine/deoxycytidylate deaminase family protein [Anaerolineae bacterium]|jgi:tRNA(Arg) A34 adenosine deaminase TadA|nr:MAG: cytidine/deoxycytidylate deaminase family protein [Anaerolineae bacterium]